MVCLAPRHILICLLLSIVVSVVTSNFFTVPGKSNCEKNVKYWIKHKFNFLEFKHWNNFIECFEKVSNDDLLKNDAKLAPYINEKEPILALKDVVLKRDFCHGDKAQLMVDYGDRFVKPYDNLHWDENANNDLNKDATDVPELIKEPTVIENDSDETTIIPDDIDSDSEDQDQTPITDFDVENVEVTAKLLQPFRKMYYGYVGQVAKICLARMQRRVLKVLEQQPELFSKKKMDKDLVDGQEELCNLVNLKHDPSSKKNRCYQILTASHLDPFFPNTIAGNKEEDTVTANQETTVDAFLAKVDAYLKKSHSNNNIEQNTEGVDAYKDAADKLTRSCAVLKSFYDAVISPATVFASAGYVIDSAEIVKKARKDKKLAKWLAIQRLCDLLLRIEYVPSRKGNDDAQSVTHNNEYYLNLDFTRKIKGDERFTIIVFNHVDYIRCRGKNNSLCGFIYVHPKRSIVIALVIGIVISALTAGIGTGITLLISGASIKLTTMLGGAISVHGAAHASGGIAFSIPNISGINTALGGLGSLGGK